MKSVSWRMFGLVFTTVTTWLVTGSVRAGITVGLLDFFVKIGTFYAHERVWHRIRWGMVRLDQVTDGSGI